LDVELRAWEAAAGAGHIEGLPEAVRRSRDRFRSLSAAAGSTAAAGSQAQAAERRQGAGPRDLWLRVDFCPTERYGMEIFVHPGSGDHRRTQPESAIISDPDDVVRRLEELSDRLRALQADELNEQRDAEELVRAATQSEAAQGGAPASGAQETHFGGREALDISSTDAMDPRIAEGYGHSGAAQQTFHPRRDGRRESSVPPGRVPWYTFRASSRLLVALWLAGGVFFVFKEVAPIVRGKAGKAPRTGGVRGARGLPALEGAQLALGPGPRLPRPGPPQSPLGLACHDPGGPGGLRLLVAERFGVRPVVLGGAPGAAPEEEEEDDEEAGVAAGQAERCLSAQPGFLGRGLAGAQLECWEGLRGNCSLVLLGADGDRALRCPPGRGSAPEVVLLPPGRWAALAVPRRRPGAASRWWAFAAGAPPGTLPRAPVRLRVRRGRGGALLRAVREPGAPDAGGPLPPRPGAEAEGPQRRAAAPPALHALLGGGGPKRS
ncbi:unnamed protein product, partial [Prorocentrum cordatum]